MLYSKEWFECMELCLGTSDKPIESLWVRVRGQTNMGDIVVGICCRLLDQGEKVDESFRPVVSKVGCAHPRGCTR